MNGTPRELLPNRRRCVHQKCRIVDPRTATVTTLHFAVGHYADGRPGEIFIDLHKQGAALRDWSSQTAMLFSIMLQTGTPLAQLCAFFIDSRSDPSGRVESHPRITRCTSVMDLIARSLAIDYLNRDDLANSEPA